jgi:glycerol-3-phosphate dehydrogenase
MFLQKKKTAQQQSQPANKNKTHPISEKVIGVRLRDNLTGIEFNTFGKTVINACGCFVDNIRRLDNPYCPELIIPSQGTHIILPGSFSPEHGYGMLIPETKDGRVCFLLPFESQTIAGTTDRLLDNITDLPYPTEEEVMEILGEVNEYLDANVDISDVDAAWAGIRPLAKIPDEYQIIPFGNASYIKAPEFDEYAVTQRYLISNLFLFSSKICKCHMSYVKKRLQFLCISKTKKLKPKN